MLQKQGVEEAQQAIQRSGLTQLLVRKCSKGTGFSKLWLLRDLEILSVMLYSSKREIHSMAQDPERDEREPEPDREQDSDHSSCCTEEPRDPSRPDPLEGLDEETKICFQVRGPTGPLGVDWSTIAVSLLILHYQTPHTQRLEQGSPCVAVCERLPFNVVTLHKH